jgi:RNA polymerase-binding transcription factor DksA
MADWTDEASDQQEQDIERALLNQRLAAKKHEAALSAASGVCLNCEEPLPTGRYCDDNCRDDHEKRLVARTGVRRR